MALLHDKNANMNAHDYASPPFRLSAVYIAYATSATGSQLKVGASMVQSKDVADVLRGVQRRVRVAVPCVGPRRKPTRPATFVWVILAVTPVVRHELEQSLVERFGDRRFDPLGTRRGEFCDPGRFGELIVAVDEWRERFPDVLSESLFSEDGGVSYVVPRTLLPYRGATAGLWVEPPAGEAVTLSVARRHIPDWARHRPLEGLVANRGSHVATLMSGHHPGRVNRLLRGFRSSPAVASAQADGYEVVLKG
ncbi:hypothetical protein [Rhizobacter sp. LjRoot28]|uniref:hypothetical protein n=1 Tax=Rhizobacter sp. LjRoot28 TaxID=3342309 RepID=UPI003ECF1B16